MGLAPADFKFDAEPMPIAMATGLAEELRRAAGNESPQFSVDAKGAIARLRSDAAADRIRWAEILQIVEAAQALGIPRPSERVDAKLRSDISEVKAQKHQLTRLFSDAIEHARGADREREVKAEKREFLAEVNAYIQLLTETRRAVRRFRGLSAQTTKLERIDYAYRTAFEQRMPSAEFVKAAIDILRGSILVTQRWRIPANLYDDIPRLLDLEQAVHDDVAKVDPDLVGRLVLTYEAAPVAA